MNLHGRATLPRTNGSNSRRSSARHLFQGALHPFKLLPQRDPGRIMVHVKNTKVNLVADVGRVVRGHASVEVPIASWADALATRFPWAVGQGPLRWQHAVLGSIGGDCRGTRKGCRCFPASGR
eukprot:scaffold1401_cov330-Pavlova_lutheri.AAC.151